MSKTAVMIFAITMMSSVPCFADTHYMLCFGGGRAALYFSAVFPVPETTKTRDVEPRFAAFIQSKYGHRPLMECHRDQTQAIADADKKSREDGFRNGKVVFNIIETGWAGK